MTLEFGKIDQWSEFQPVTPMQIKNAFDIHDVVVGGKKRRVLRPPLIFVMSVTSTLSSVRISGELKVQITESKTESAELIIPPGVMQVAPSFLLII